MRFALLLAALAPLAALAQTQADALTPVLVTFHSSAQTLTGRWWKGGGSYTWNAVTANGSPNLLDASGAASGLSLTCNGTICGSPGKLTSEQYADRAKDFPKGITTGDNGWVLNGNGSCSFTLSGLDAQAAYTLYVLAGRGNSWENADSTYAVTGATLAYAENKSGEADLTQNTSSGNWLVFAVTFTGRTSVTVSAQGGDGNFGAFALEGTVPARWQWANPKGGRWSDAANWANAEAGGEPWLLDLEDANGAVEIDYDAAPEPERVRYDAGSTAYVLKAGAFACAFVDGEVAKDGPGTVTLTSAETTAAFYVAEGTLRVDGAAGLVTVAPGAALAGTGRVGALALADGAVLDAAAGALEVGALSLLQPTLLDKSLPDGETLAAAAAVTVRNAREGEVLRCAAGLPEGLTFVLPEEDGGALIFEDGTLRYTPPPAPSYRMSLR